MAGPLRLDYRPGVDRYVQCGSWAVQEACERSAPIGLSAAGWRGAEPGR
jgi:hypothetical protein